MVECLLQSLQPSFFQCRALLPKRFLELYTAFKRCCPSPDIFLKGRRGVLTETGAVAITSEKACLRRSLKRPPSNSVLCRAAEPGVSQRCKKNILCRQRQQTALKKSNKVRAATQCMVSGTVSVTDVTSQPLRCCPSSCCSSLSQPQTISHLFLECPAAATVISWLCRLWHAMTGHMPQTSVATILAATTAEGQCASEALLQTWHRLRLAVLHSIWAASQVAQHASATQSHPPASPTPSQPPAQLTSRLALKTVNAMVRQDWAKCNDTHPFTLALFS